ncbi:peptide deformylase-like [Ylistrum balloti]|uniref:peptide deformylase-like n=1 Tax=Ylistrum balloti TaxID=509963 RepID=UPI002905D1A3|nr:peptide deformylase-like [Ylistrum balloti]
MGYNLVYHPHETLRKKSQKVQRFNKELHTLLAGMKCVLEEKKGCGLAATQLDCMQRCFLVKFEETLHTFINPEITYLSKSTIYYEEGCLSIPGVYAHVERPKVVHVRAQKEDGEYFEIETDTFLGRIILHEFDHMEGVLFIDHLPKGMRRKLLLEYEALQREWGVERIQKQ